MKKGFTLIELLVVIAVIAILAAILFPVFAKAREKARQSACLSNLKQISNGLMMYVQDYDETLPIARYTASAAPVDGGTSWYWSDQIYQYINNKQIFLCPSSKHIGRPGDGNKSWVRFYNYGMNMIAQGLPMAKINSPATKYLISDSSCIDLNPGRCYAPIFQSQGYYLPGSYDFTSSVCTGLESFTPTMLEDYKTGRHSGGITVVFCDGHVKWIDSRTAYTESKNTASGAWYPDK